MRKKLLLIPLMTLILASCGGETSSSSSVTKKEPLEVVSEFLENLRTNYTININDVYSSSHDLLVSEYGIYDELNNNNYGSYVKDAQKNIYHRANIKNDNSIVFYPSNQLSEADYSSIFNPLINNASYSSSLSVTSHKSVVASIYGDYDRDGNFVVTPTIGSWFVTTFSPGMEEYTNKLEFIVEDNSVTKIYALINDVYLPQIEGTIDIITENNKHALLELTPSNVGSTVVEAAKQYYDSGAYPVFGTEGSWNEILTKLKTNFASTAETSSVANDIANALAAVLPSISGTLDYEIYYEPDAIHYFSRTKIGIYSSTPSETNAYNNQLKALTLSTNAHENAYGSVIVNSPRKVFASATYSAVDKVMVIDLCVEKNNMWSNDSVTDLLSKINVTLPTPMPALTGAKYYRYNRDLSGTYIDAFFDIDTDLSPIVTSWETILLAANWSKVKTTSGTQYQDPAKTLGIVISKAPELFAGASELYIDFFEALPGTQLNWPSAELESHGYNIIPELPVNTANDGGYSFVFHDEADAASKYIPANTFELSIFEPSMSVALYGGLLTKNYGFTRVFAGAGYTNQIDGTTGEPNGSIYVSSDESIIVQLSFVQTYLLLYVYPNIDTTSSGTNYGKPYVSLSNEVYYNSTSEARYLGSSMTELIGSTANNNLPLPNAANAKYQIILTTYMFGNRVSNVPIAFSYAYYITGLSDSELEAWRNEISSWIKGSDGFYYSDEHKGTAIKYLDYGDGSILVGGSQFYTNYSSYIDATTDVYQNLRNDYPQYGGQIGAATSNFVNLSESPEVSEYQLYAPKLSYNNAPDYYEIDVLGLPEDNALAFKDSFFSNTAITWSDAGEATLTGYAWKESHAIILDQERFALLVVTIAYFKNVGLTIIFDIR
jgi:hypothetical protein